MKFRSVLSGRCLFSLKKNCTFWSHTSVTCMFCCVFLGVVNTLSYLTMPCVVAYQEIFFRSFELLHCSEKFTHQGTLSPMSLRSYLCFARMVVLSSIFLCDNTVGSPDPHYCRVCSEFWAISIINLLGLNKSTREINFLAVTSHRQQFIICTLVDASSLFILHTRSTVKGIWRYA